MKKKFIWWSALASIAVIAALIVPESYFEKFSGFFGADQAPSPFEDIVATTDRGLQQDFDILVDLPTLEEMVPRIQVRRLAAHGPIAADEIPRILDTLQRFQVNTQSRNSALTDLLKRWERPQIEAALNPLDEELARVRTRFSKVPNDCIQCHLQTIPAPDQPIDVIGLWPLVPPESLDFGKQIPILSDSMEQDAIRHFAHPDRMGKGPFSTEEAQQMLNTSCVSCHSPHGETGFPVDLTKRMDNIGLWLNAYNADDVLHVQTKVQSLRAAHRVPGGWADHAYVLLVEAWDGDGKPLTPFHGSTLPDFLQNADLPKAGSLHARLLVDADAKPTSDLSKVHNILSDTRLEPRRFEDMTFLFPLTQNSPARVRVRMIYLPDFTTWEGAQDVEVRTAEIN